MRKIIQICAIPCGTGGDATNTPALMVLCNDNSVWQFERGEWRKVTDIPQPPLGKCAMCNENREDDYASYRFGGIKLCKKCFCEEIDSYYGKPK